MEKHHFPRKKIFSNCSAELWILGFPHRHEFSGQPAPSTEPQRTNRRRRVSPPKRTALHNKINDRTWLRNCTDHLGHSFDFWSAQVGAGCFWFWEVSMDLIFVVKKKQRNKHLRYGDKDLDGKKQRLC